jgi:saccharopine dehydrogenase-like NADP-dependent oxidoreductase
VSEMTCRDFINSFLDFHPVKSVEEKLCAAFGLQYEGGEMQRLLWSGLFSSEKIGLSNGTPAQILEHILNKKWKLVAGDKDMIVMWHRFKYSLDNVEKITTAHLIVRGEDEIQTAMAKTVGLPLGIATKLLLEEKINERGVQIPIHKNLYQPILHALDELGISMVENETHSSR